MNDLEYLKPQALYTSSILLYRLVFWLVRAMFVSAMTVTISTRIPPSIARIVLGIWEARSTCAW